MLGFLKNKFDRVRNALKKTRTAFGQRLKTLFSGPIDEESLDQVEELLYEADLGVETTQEIIASLRQELSRGDETTPEALISHIEMKLISNLENSAYSPKPHTPPKVILIVGVNGNGKTSSVAKLAKKHSDDGKKVIVAAADTFRAAATEQLDLWAKKLGIEIIKGKHKSDPAAVAFDAATAAKARGADILIIDTAGRLHTKTHLMHELEKIKRSCNKVIENSPHETLLVLDATTGQNAVDQAKTFHEFTPISGVILTKLDGTAKGGIAVAIQRSLSLPIAYIGTGESAEDLAHFDAKSYIKSLF